MPVEKWSDSVLVARLADDPQLTDDLEALEQRLAAGPKRDAVLDFKAVHFINSSNIAKLLKIRKNMAGAGTRLVLCGVTDQVWGAFLVTGLDKLFDFTGDVSTALATVQMTK